MDSENRVILAGLPGVGKTTVLNELKRLAGEEKLPLKIVNYGTVMLRIAEEKVKDRDDIRGTSLNLQRKLQIRAAEEIVQENHVPSGVLIVDTHVTVRTPFGYLPGIPSHVLSVIKPKLIVLLEAPSEEIISRRTKDVSVRKRDEALRKEVEVEVQVSRMMASACSVLAGVPLGVIENPPEAATQAAKELFRMVKAAIGWET